MSKFDLGDIIRGIKSSYGDKYSEYDYKLFEEQAKDVTVKKELISLVSNLFDLDYSDARDMVG